MSDSWKCFSLYILQVKKKTWFHILHWILIKFNCDTSIDLILHLGTSPLCWRIVSLNSLTLEKNVYHMKQLTLWATFSICLGIPLIFTDFSTGSKQSPCDLCHFCVGGGWELTCVCVCTRACGRVRACVRACVHARACVCVCVCVCVHDRDRSGIGGSTGLPTTKIIWIFMHIPRHTNTHARARTHTRTHTHTRTCGV